MFGNDTSHRCFRFRPQPHKRDERDSIKEDLLQIADHSATASNLCARVNCGRVGCSFLRDRFQRVFEGFPHSSVCWLCHGRAAGIQTETPTSRAPCSPKAAEPKLIVTESRNQSFTSAQWWNSTPFLVGNDPLCFSYTLSGKESRHHFGMTPHRREREPSKQRQEERVLDRKSTVFLRLLGAVGTSTRADGCACLPKRTTAPTGTLNVSNMIRVMHSWAKRDVLQALVVDCVMPDFSVLLVHTNHHAWHLKAQREVHHHQQKPASRTSAHFFFGHECARNTQNSFGTRFLCVKGSYLHERSQGIL